MPFDDDGVDDVDDVQINQLRSGVRCLGRDKVHTDFKHSNTATTWLQPKHHREQKSKYTDYLRLGASHISTKIRRKDESIVFDEMWLGAPWH